MTEIDLDIAIIGGGIVGAACAYYLSQRGTSCTIFDGDDIGTKASGKAFGGLNSVSGFEIPGTMWELSQYSTKLHSSLRNTLGEISKVDCKYRTRDTLNLAFSTREMHELKAHSLWIGKSTQLESKILRPSEIFEIEPRVSGLIVGGRLLRGTSEVDSHNLTVALVQASSCNHIRQNVVGLKLLDNRIRMVLENKSELTAQWVVCANGTWATPLLKTVGIKLEISPLKGEILRLDTRGSPLTQSIGWMGNYCSTKTDGLTWAGTTETRSHYDESTTIQGRLSILSNLRRVLPNLVVRKILRQTACLRPTTRDGFPAIGQVGSIPNLLIATGGGRKGVLYGPAMGKIISDIINGNKSDLDIEPFRAGRLVANT